MSYVRVMGAHLVHAMCQGRGGPSGTCYVSGVRGPIWYMLCVRGEETHLVYVWYINVRDEGAHLVHGYFRDGN